MLKINFHKIKEVQEMFETRNKAKKTRTGKLNEVFP